MPSSVILISKLRRVCWSLLINSSTILCKLSQSRCLSFVTFASSACVGTSKVISIWNDRILVKYLSEIGGSQGRRKQLLAFSVNPHLGNRESVVEVDWRLVI